MNDYINYYDLLGIDRNASSDEIKSAYRNQAKKWHPDLNKDPKAPEMAKKINEAKETLVTLAMADKANIMTNKIFNGAIEGRVSKQLKDICLLDQTYVRAEDGKQTVGAYLKSVNGALVIKNVVRFEVGEGMEKKQDDFAAEVAAQMNA